MVTILVILVVIYYLGEHINSVLSGAGEIGSKQFDYYKAETEVDLAKKYDKLAKRLDEADISNGKADVYARLDVLNKQLSKERENNDN